MSGKISFHQPRSIVDAVSILSKKGEAKILAGGTDLIVKMRNGIVPDLTDLVDIGRLGLSQIRIVDGNVVIGCACTMTQIAQEPIIIENFPGLANAVQKVGAHQIRNLATIGGNVCNASPAGDSIPALMCLEAVALVHGPGRMRRVSMIDFFAGPGKTVLEKGEMVEALEIPLRHTKGVFFKLGERRAHAISKVSVAVSIWSTKAGTPAVRIALGAVAPKVIPCRKAEELLENEVWPLSSEVVKKAADMAVETAAPIDDIRSVKTYREKMVGVLLERALKELSLES